MAGDASASLVEIRTSMPSGMIPAMFCLNTAHRCSDQRRGNAVYSWNDATTLFEEALVGLVAKE